MLWPIRMDFALVDDDVANFHMMLIMFLWVMTMIAMNANVCGISSLALF